MSTRAVVAIPEGTEWRGRYVHWGEDLAPALRVILARDGYARAVAVLLFDHGGWSEVTGQDRVGLDPGRDLDRFLPVDGYGIAYTEAEEPLSEWITPASFPASWIERAYLLTPDGVVAWDIRDGLTPPRVNR